MLDLLDHAAHAAGKSRGQCFDDFLELVVTTLSGGRMEEQYLAVARRYSAGERGKRGIDHLASAFGALVKIMDEARADILGDLFQGAITRGENGQFLTPETLTDCMAAIVDHDDGGGSKTVCDPCCGSGRLLLSAAKVNRSRTFIGQDIDLRCVRMTAINLALHNLYGWVIWGNSLTLEQRLVYRTGFDGQGVIAEVPVVEPSPRVEESPRTAPDPGHDGQAAHNEPEVRKDVQQRLLFE